MLSDDWKKEAIKRFPEFSVEDHERWDSPHIAWQDITIAFRDAYKYPRNEDFIKRVYEYAHWCMRQPEGRSADDDLGSMTIVGFFEDVPTSEEAMKDMPRWFTLDQVIHMEETFSYMVGKEGFQKILKIYKEAQQAT